MTLRRQSAINTATAPKPMRFASSSGLTLGLGTWDVFVFNVLGYATGLSLATNPTVLGGLYPNASIYWTLLFGFLLSVCFGWSYGMFASLYPETGGDYRYIGRGLGRGVGFVASWGFTWSQIYGIGVFSGWAIRDSLSPAFLLCGYAYDSTSLVLTGQWLASRSGRAMGGGIVLLFCALFSMLKQKQLKSLLTTLFIVAMLSATLMVIAFYGVDHTTFVRTFDSFMANHASLPNAYKAIIASAQQSGLSTGHAPSIWESLKALPVGFLVFFGFTYSVYLGGEVREPDKAQIRGVLAALAIAALFSFVGMGLYFNVVGQDFNSAISIVKAQNNGPLPAGGSMVFFAGLLLKKNSLLALMAFGSFLWFFLLPLVMMALSVRNVLAWSYDKVLPTIFTYVGSDNRPIPATCAVTIFSIPFLLADSLGEFPYVNYTLLFSVCFCLTGIAGAVLPYRKKTQNDYRLAPPLVRLSVGRASLFSLSSAISSIMFAFVVWSALEDRNFSGVRAGPIPFCVLIAVYGVGALIWYLRGHAKGSSISSKALYSQMPPEMRK